MTQVTEIGIGFGYKLQWLAVYDQGADTVAAVLGLSRPSSATWRDAVAAAYQGHGSWLLTPSLDGWTLAASRNMSAPEDDRFAAWLAELSHHLGEVQYFGTHRVVDYHGWGRASNGVVERAYAYLGERGEVLFNLGDPTADEQSLGVGTVHDENEPWHEEDDSWPWPDEETVLTLAGRWSIDPRTLDNAPVPGHPWIAASAAT